MSSPLLLTTTMVNLKNPNKSLKNLVLSLGLQDSSQCVGEFPDSSDLLSRASSRAGKWVHSRGRPQTCHIARCSSRSISASSASRNVSPEAVALSSLGESKEENMDSDSRTFIVLRMIIVRTTGWRLQWYCGDYDFFREILSIYCLNNQVHDYSLGKP